MDASHTARSLTTSSPPPPHLSLARAPAREAGRAARPKTPPSPASPAWSTASTADAGPSPSLPALPAPRLPERVLALLRTPPPADFDADGSRTGDDDGRFVTASWGSPYPRSDAAHLRHSSLSSEPSEDSPIHQLEIHTPFLRPAPFIADNGSGEDDDDDAESEDLSSSSPFSVLPSSSLVSANVLANRARRPARGLTEDWIRQHTTGELGSEARLWLSDNSSPDDSENSSLSGSVSGSDGEDGDVENVDEDDGDDGDDGSDDDDGDDVDERALRTPRAALANRRGRTPSNLASSTQKPRRKPARHPRHRSSLETLRESDLGRPYRRALIAQSEEPLPSTAAATIMAATSILSQPAATAANTNTAEPPAATTMADGSVKDESAVNVASGPEAPTTPSVAKATLAQSPKAVPALPPSTPPQKALPGSRPAADGIQPSVSLDPLGELAVSKMSSSPKKTPRRVKKKLLWNGKTIYVLLPHDEQRGKPGKAPTPLSKDEVDNMLHSWEELGYNIQGFDLDHSAAASSDDVSFENRSMSRTTWPDEAEMARERALRKYPVLLPDLNAWKNYVEELNEAKLRALGVSFGDEEPSVPSSISPAIGASLSRQSSATVYPPLPFSPPIPTSSASSNHGGPPFTFPPAAFVPGVAGLVGSSAAQSPSITSATSPIPFGVSGHYNARQSISIPAGVFQMPPMHQTTPGGFSPQALMLQQGLVRGGSPSLAALSSVMSPASPFTPDGSFTSPPLHQRHQSLQYPLTQYPQLQTSARASPRLQELREEDEEQEKALSKSPSKTPEPPTVRPFVQHNASLSLQKEIDDAEYHLEEQFRSQFEHDRDYSPHGGRDPSDAFGISTAAAATANPTVPQHAHARGHSVQFASTAPIQRFRDDAESGPPLHHPRPHSRGHSLANAYYVDPEEARNGGDAATFGKAAPLPAGPAQDAAQNAVRLNDAYEVETNPSNLGTPVQGLEYSTILQQNEQKQPHQRAFSTASNPWSENGSMSGKPSTTRRTSHGSKASLSNLNVEAPEFKFNPGAASTFQPTMTSQFLFGNGPNPAGAAFQPSIFQAGLAPSAPPLDSSGAPFGLASTVTTTKINANAPTFSPGQSDFSFSAAGPKFRPDAPAFTPIRSVSNSLTSPIQSGSESVSGANRTSSIFGNIDLSIPDVIKPAKRSKAVPIVRPSSRHSPKLSVDKDDEKEGAKYDREGRIIDDSRVKRARAATKDDGNDEALFAEPSNNALTVASATPEPAPLADVAVLPSVEAPEDGAESATPHAEVEAEADKSHDEGEGESGLAGEDTTLSSTVLSESTDAAKMPTTTSPSDLSPLPGSLPWAPFEFRSEAEVADFNSARPMGDDIFRHKKSLSATAKPFTPGASFQGSVTNAFGDENLTSDEFLPSATGFNEVRKASPEPVPVSSPEKTETVQFSSPPPPPPAKEKPKGLAASRYATASPPPPPPKAPVWPSSPSSPPAVPSKDTKSPEDAQPSFEPQLVMPAPDGDSHTESKAPKDEEPVAETTGTNDEPTFEEIDDIMRHISEVDPAQGVNKVLDSTPWHQPAPAMPGLSLAAAASESPLHLPVPSASLPYQTLAIEQPQEPHPSTEMDDPLIDPLSAAHSTDVHGVPGHDDVAEQSVARSEWEGDFTGEEQLKLESRVNFFDGHVNQMVGGIIAARLGPLEKALDRIQHAIASMSRDTPSSRRERRSNSGEVQESDADDEDDEMPPVPRSMSPRRDRRMEQVRAAVLEALAAHQAGALSAQSVPPSSSTTPAAAAISSDAVGTILKSLEDVKEHLGQSLRLDFRGEDLRNIVEDAVERRMPMTPQSAVAARELEDDERQKKEGALQARIAELEDRLRLEEAKTESEISIRRVADDQVAELRRKLELAETKIEAEIMNRSIYDQHVSDLQDQAKRQEEKSEAEVAARHAAEDRMAEVQRLLRIASEEEMRLREAVDERDEKLKALNESSDQDRKRLAALEASQVSSEQTHIDLQNRLNSLEGELREKAQESRHWRAEAERAIDLSQRQGNDLMQTATELKHLKRVVDTLGTQLEENERLRETWRTKFLALQEDMSRAAHEVAEESAAHIKREQTLMARHDVLDAKLQAEARTRERLESELERLEGGERQAMRAVSECKRLEALLGELRSENHKLQQSSLRYQSEFAEARESAAREVQRTRDSMQAQVEEANHQVNVVRGELEDQMARLRGQLDQAKLDADTSKARLEMLLEEAETTKRTALEAADAAKRLELEAAERRHQNEVEDLQARYERQINNAAEDAQRAEQHLLERLSISTSKTEHLQDRVAHLEEKLEIAREAAQAAAKAAAGKATAPAAALAGEGADASREATTTSGAALQPAAAVKAASHHGLGLPEKISPQALRESILVLQEQLQQREQRIEELEHTLDKVDPEADVKIAKRDDEILWLRELLAVRHSDLKDIITALGRDDHDPDRVRDAVIRLQANLQMEEQERERAMNGGSAIKLPALAASLRDAATPRVAQAVGPLAAAWGSWRKARDSNASMAGAGGAFSSLSGALLSSPAPTSASRRGGGGGGGTGAGSATATPTPSRGASSSVSSRAGPLAETEAARGTGDSSFLSGLLTPPTSGMRQTPPSRAQADQHAQPTAYGGTGRRYTGEQTAGRRTSRSDSGKLATRDLGSTPPPPTGPFRRASRGQPVTPPMMRTSAYDSDAATAEFDDAAFFDD